MTNDQPDFDPTPDMAVPPSSGLPDDGIELTGMPSNPEGIDALLSSDGGLDFGALMEQAGAMQSQMLAAQEEMANQIVEGMAGGGAVRIKVSGAFEFQSVTIDPSAVDPDDVEMLQDLVLAALHDAISQVNGLQAGAVDLSGLGLDGLLGG